MENNLREISRRPEVPMLTDKAIILLTDLCFKQPDSLSKADMIFVFGVMKQALVCANTIKDLLDQNLANKVMLTGGMPSFEDSYSGYIKPESKILLDNIDQNKYKEVEFYCEETSNNTLENVTNALNIYDFTKLDKIIYVAKSLHAIRCYLTLKRFLPTQELILVTYDQQGEDGELITKDNWYKTENGRQKVYSQYLRLGFYGRRGDIAFDPIKEQIEELEALGYK